MEQAWGLMEKAWRKSWDFWRERRESIGIDGESMEKELGLLKKA